MEQERKNEAHLRKYLLGVLNESDEHAFEEQLLADEELSELLLAEEEELIDDYLRGELSEGERERFDSHFMVTPERRRKLRFGDAFRRHGVGASGDLSPEGLEKQPTQEKSTGAKNSAGEPMSKEPPLRLMPATPGAPVTVPEPARWNLAFTPYLKLAAAAVIAIGLALGIWRPLFSKSEIEKGVSALARAYSVERPTDARLTGLGYARYPNTRRGDEPRSVDVESLLFAEVTLLSEVAERPSADAHHALGEVYLSKGNYEAAINHFEEALKAEPNNAKFESDYGAALLEMGKAEPDRGKALDLISQACERFKRATALDEAHLEALFNLALCHLEMSLDDQAEDAWRRYLEKDPDSKWADEVRQRLASLEQRKQKAARNEDQLFEDFVSAYRSKDDVNAWQAFRRTRSRKGNLITARLIDSYLESLATQDNRQAADYLQIISYAANLEQKNAQDKFTKDLVAYYQRASRSHGPALIEARNAMKVASDAYEKEEYGESSRRYATAAGLFTQAGDSAEAILCEFWTGVARLRTNARRSLSILEPLSRTCSDRGYRYLLAQTLNAVADAKSSLRLISESLDIGARTFDLSEQLQDPNGMLRSLLIPIGMHQRLGEYQRSLGYVSRAFEIATEFSPEPYEIWPVYHQAAFNLYSLGKLGAALDYQEKALQVAVASGLPFLKSRSFARLGLYYDKQQRPDDAIKSVELALGEAERIKNQESRNNITANSTLLLAHVYRQQGDFARAVTYYDQAIELHRGLTIESYLFEAHHGKLTALAGLNDDRATESEMRTAVKVVEEYRSVILDDSSRNSFFDLAQGIYDVAIEFSYERLQRPDIAFHYAESSHARSLLDLMRMTADINPKSKRAFVTAPLRLEEIWDQMPEDSQIVQFSVLDNRTLAWVIAKGTIECKETVVAAAALKDLVLRFRDLIGNPESGDPQVQQVARELYELLISRVKPLLKPNSYLCIVPDKVLFYLPFDAMISDDSTYFVEDWCFGLAPSATIFVESTHDARRKERADPERLLAIGNPSFDSTRFRDLRAAADEVARISRLYMAPLPLYGSEARELRIKAEMKRADVIQVATHYVVDRESPLQSSLLLAREAQDGRSHEDGFLRASEVYEMTMPRTRLVVLSACETGIERAYRGEGAISVARPFLKARVPLVVASLWAVDSESTAQLMTSFHRHRKQVTGVSTAQALRAAQLQMLAGPDLRYRHPYYWAPFAVIGGYSRF